MLSTCRLVLTSIDHRTRFAVTLNRFVVCLTCFFFFFFGQLLFAGQKRFLLRFVCSNRIESAIDSIPTMTTICSSLNPGHFCSAGSLSDAVVDFSAEQIVKWPLHTNNNVANQQLIERKSIAQAEGDPFRPTIIYVRNHITPKRLNSQSEVGHT